MKKEEGCVALFWVVISFIFDSVFLIAYLVWKSKIALFLLGIGTVLLVFTIVIFVLFIHYARRELKRKLKQKAHTTK
ncbi:hypothetical protein [Lactobacillus sp. ESL0677]|uniref:hypothetical protein n=1 Tax=Lactobacillus sp. ESL0677 TaxID=2983208 RepID=UPI0023F93E65|nr:hypothetical protein [Lactobacillus sp. ESL0677]WEV36257.1 hypothetical protein OZX76_05785 [Lactobacillus sp. ESL0677]